ncbi:MAG: hypothetical protein QXD48_03510 [Candidatus Aenigmatarchaeota archaeon]
MDYLKEHKKEMEMLYKLMRPILDNEYKTDERQEKTIQPTFPREPITREIIKEAKIVKKQAIPRFEDEEITPLKKMTPKLIGNIFDRVKFLEQRISDVKNAIELREKLHIEIINSINDDIREKEKMVMNIPDIDERRNLKLDISLLMKEKRKEDIEFWRDTFTLRSELRELLEQLQIEKKIVSIFSDLNGE